MDLDPYACAASTLTHGVISLACAMTFWFSISFPSLWDVYTVYFDPIFSPPSPNSSQILPILPCSPKFVPSLIFFSSFIFVLGSHDNLYTHGSLLIACLSVSSSMISGVCHSWFWGSNSGCHVCKAPPDYSGERVFASFSAHTQVVIMH